jgi:hypothetical protein
MKDLSELNHLSRFVAFMIKHAAFSCFVSPSFIKAPRVFVLKHAANVFEQEVYEVVDAQVLTSRASHPHLDAAVPTLCNGCGVVVPVVHTISKTDHPHVAPNAERSMQPEHAPPLQYMLP